MTQLRSPFLLLVTILILAVPAAAETYTITLHNGNTFISRYRPEEAKFDASQMIFLTDMGNWISLAKTEIADIVSETESRGFGYVINTTTILLGWAPNDAPTQEQAAEAAAAAGARGPQVPQPEPYTAPLFSEPNATGGLPLNFLGTTTPPLGGSGGNP